MKKILILENDKSISNTINHLLKEEYEIVFPDNGFVKNSQLSKQIPDMVIADLTSIKNEKVELLMQLKSNPVISLVPFLLITSGKNGIMKEFDPGFTYQLCKPYSDDDLLIIIKKIFQRSADVSPW